MTRGAQRIHKRMSL